MVPLSSFVSKILSSKNDFCRLCLNTTGKDAVHTQDQVVVDFGSSLNTEEMSKIMTFVLGAEFSANITIEDFVCEDCFKIVISSYKFIKKCKENLEHLTNVMDTLNYCFENTTDDLDTFKTLFVSINTQDFTCQQYYDSKSSFSNTKTAIQRFRYIAHGKDLHRKVPKERKEKHNLDGGILLDICNIIKEKNSPTKYQCKVCFGIFSKSFNFKKHYYSQHSPKVLKCSECPRSYGSESLLKQHKYDCHASMVCSECGKKYSNRYSLLYHMRCHTGEQPYECKYCNLKFQWSSRRAEHVRRHHMDAGLECSVCHNKFHTLGSLYDHRKRHSNPKSRLHVPLPVDCISSELRIPDAFTDDFITEDDVEEVFYMSPELEVPIGPDEKQKDCRTELQ